MDSQLPNPRYERKFAIRDCALAEVLTLVRRHPAGFREAFPPRMVNNVYLDSPQLASYHEHVDGASNRVKTRVRWYGEAHGEIPVPVLERKLKRGLISGKTAQPLPAFSLNGEGVAPLFDTALRSPGLPESWRAGLAFLHPSLFNRYQRRYFVSADGAFRLTVDSELKFGPPRTVPFPARGLPESLVVVELKFAPEQADHAPHITNKFPFRIVRCSKYVLGLERMSLGLGAGYFRRNPINAPTPAAPAEGK